MSDSERDREYGVEHQVRRSQKALDDAGIAYEVVTGPGVVEPVDGSL